MKLIDTGGWIEELTAGQLAEQFSPYLQHPEELIVLTVVQYGQEYRRYSHQFLQPQTGVTIW